MKKFLIILLMITVGVCSYSKTYNVSRDELLSLVEQTVDTMETENKEEWITLLNGTLAVETNIGQFKGNSKIGVAQMHSIAYKHNRNLLMKDKVMADKVYKFTGKRPVDITFSDVVHNHKIGIVFMYLHYKYHKIDITKASTIQGAGKLWKKYYNTYEGKGTVERFVKVYNDNKKYFTNKTIKEDVIKDKNDEKLIISEGEKIMINTRVMTVKADPTMQIYTLPIVINKDIKDKPILDKNTIIKEYIGRKGLEGTPITIISGVETLSEEEIRYLDIVSAYIYKSFVVYYNTLIATEYYNHFNDIDEAKLEEIRILKEELIPVIEFSNNLLYKYLGTEDKIDYIDIDYNFEEDEKIVIRLIYKDSIIHILL